MSRYRGPRVKIVRRLGRLPGLTRKSKGKPGHTSRYTFSGKASQYRIRLEEKQKLRFHYGLTEQQLLRYVRAARRARGSTGRVLLRSLGARLDNIVLELGMAPTIPGARQMVAHKHILVNDRLINIPSYHCGLEDAIAVGPGHTPKVNGPTENRPSRIQLNLYPRLGSVDNEAPADSKRAADLPNINELLVVEYYSRQA
uniref:Small ribosomal subunit protein uS4c n=1 Tax=Selaginella kraussiana TaxID=81964 RepID=A0A3T0IAV2_9TRAC|nr:ribosomal protein S4 [Selaginella kraussiana]AZU95818.1 ribosomal protein S4 [Selaginella kraussiana]